MLGGFMSISSSALCPAGGAIGDTGLCSNGWVVLGVISASCAVGSGQNSQSRRKLYRPIFACN